MGTGRKGKFEEVMKHVEQIKEWKKFGATDKQICEQLGINPATFYEWKNTKPEFANAVENAKREFVKSLKGELAKIATTHEITTTKSYIKKDLESGHETEYTEIVKKQVDPNIGAIHMLLKNLDAENWKENWDNYNFKQLELEIKKKLADAKVWDA